MKSVAKTICILSLGIFLSAERKANAQAPVTFNYTGSVQTWTVPTCVSSVTILANGAQGGDVNGGLGAQIEGTFTVTAGNVLDIMVGQLGHNNSANYGGAGGGGSFVWNSSSSNLLMIAAGGGGGGVSQCTGEPGGSGSANTTPTASAGAGGGAGGSGGNGGSYGTGSTSYGVGGGGCGWNSNGLTNPGSYSEGEGGGGFTPLNGGAGGAAGVGSFVSGAGGYGGGGGEAGQCGAGGGGGGYNGGGGGNAFSGSYWGSGGGGGSYNGGSGQNNIAGVNSGNGSVTIYYSGVSISPNVISNVTCDGGSNGSASVTVTAGTPPFTYSWLPGGQTTSTITGLTAGIYTITVSEGCGASASATVDITQPNPLLVSANTIRSIVCNGGSTGLADVTVSGGSIPYTYSWSPSGGTGDTTIGVTSGTYNITVTDLCGTTASSSTYISQPNPIGVGAFVTANETCNGGNNGSATAFAYSGTPAYSYAWAPAGGTNASATGLTAGSYTVTATDSCGQSSTIQVSITEPNPVVVTLNATANEICRGAFEGSASSNISGGTLPFTYSWTGGAGSTDTASGLAAGTYTLSVVDMNGCTGSSSVAITQPNMLGAIAGVTGDVSCNGGSNGSASVSASGGTAAYTYSWFPSGGNNPSASGLSAGTYTVTIDDACNGSASATVVITQTSAIIVSTATTGNALCNGGTDGSANSSVSGGTAPYTYLWTGGSTNSIASGLSAGTYTLTVEDGDGCTATSSTVIMQPTALSIVKDSVPDDGHCHGSAWVTVSGGVGPYNYDWSNGNTTYLDNNICKGSYCCTVTDANGCKDSVCVKITSTLGVDGIASNEGEINIYPNPNNGQFTIETSLGIKSLVEIYNVLGEKIYGSGLNSATGINTINISNQPNGIYLYRILSEGGNLLGEGKTVIQK